MLTIRPPLVYRVALGAAGVVGLGVVLLPGVVFTAMDRDLVGITFFALFAVVWSLLWLRTLLLKVEVASDGRLVVRSTLRSQVFQRHDVRGFRLPPTGLAKMAQGNRVVLVLADGRELLLDATAAWPLPGRRRKLAEMVEKLDDWAAGRSA